MFSSVRESKLILIKILLVTILKLCACKMEEKVVGGALANIKEFPHAMFIEANCGGLVWACGASILNQKIIITAGHCLDGCNMKWDSVGGYAGSADFTAKTAVYRKMDRIVVHEYYKEISGKHDIGLARVQHTFPLNNNIKRLIIPRSYPNTQTAKMAGWGYTHVLDRPSVTLLVDLPDGSPLQKDKIQSSTKHLKFANQAIRSPQACGGIIGFSYGMLCAGGADKQDSHPARGDSGSALVTADHTQMGMGIVSFVDPKHLTVVVYTNLTYHYNWILANAKALYCDFKI